MQPLHDRSWSMVTGPWRAFGIELGALAHSGYHALFAWWFSATDAGHRCPSSDPGLSSRSLTFAATGCQRWGLSQTLGRLGSTWVPTAELETLSNWPAKRVNARRREFNSRRRVFSASFPLICEGSQFDGLGRESASPAGLSRIGPKIGEALWLSELRLQRS